MQNSCRGVFVLLDNLRKTNTVISVSAGNNGAWSDNSYFGALYSDDVNFHTGGSPGTYANALNVASVDTEQTTGGGMLLAAYGTYTYASCFNSGKNSVTLYAIDTEVTGNIYKLGSFADGVWPVGGLAQLSPAETEVSANAEKLADDKVLENAELKTIDQIEKITIIVGK